MVVGASLAGLRAAETLRREGFTGTVTVVGAEGRRPYDRPPLSKQILTGEWEPERIVLAAAEDDELHLTWELGVAAAGLDLDDRSVALADGRSIPFDGLVIASGSSPRNLPGTAGVGSVHTLRTVDDSLAVRRVLDAGSARIAVVGAGFIGAEVAASCRSRDAEVAMIEPLEAPLARVLGTEIGGVVADVHREHGVDLRLGTGVTTIEGDDRQATVHLDDGTTVDADAVVVGIGVVPNTGWLEGSGLTVDNGVVCDATTLAAPGVVAAGDVARWHDERAGRSRRVEHWEHALDMAAHAARRLLAGDGPGEPYTPVAWFWSDQYDRKIQLAGTAHPDAEIEVVAGSYDDRRFCALYRDGDEVGAALAMNMPAQVVRYRRAIADGLGWDDALRAARSAD